MTNKTRQKSIQHALHMVESAGAALVEMDMSPDLPTDLSSYPVGCFVILKSCGVKLLWGCGEVFGIMSPESSTDNQE